MKFADLVTRVSGEGADAWRVHYEAVAARERGADVIILSVGDPDLDTPAEVTARAVAALKSGDTHYVPAAGRGALRAAIAAAHARRSGQAVGAEHVVCLAGAQNALFVASLCLADPGDEVITFEPLYPTYPATIEVSGARLVRAPATEACRPDLDALERLLSPRSRAIFWATPNNPSGVILSDAELSRIGALAQRHDLWLVSDEVYAGLAPQGRVPSLAAQLPERVVTVGSLSKSHAMTGWRAGWLIGPPRLAQYAEQLAMCMLFGLPGFIQEAALVALANAPAAEAQVREYCRLRRERLAAGVRDIAGVRALEPEAGMFMLLDVAGTGLTGEAFTQQLYAAEGVAVMDGAAFGRATAHCVRVCFAVEEAALAEACARLRRFCAALARRRA
ncbi:MAG: pyridoxal phosphate-dependent aminotransferase [Gammaproteobacteria bacterium]|nr:pyridoxal phosphate-dependent aminotransferase [Gammaproteobacteria bacterium]